jgi:hypothetical protein
MTWKWWLEMTEKTLSFTSSVDLPDGRHIYVSIEIPATNAAGLPRRDIGEHTEIAQIGAAAVLNNLLRADAARDEAPF